MQSAPELVLRKGIIASSFVYLRSQFLCFNTSLLVGYLFGPSGNTYCKV